jgi:AraC-like DNA-binding protein
LAGEKDMFLIDVVSSLLHNMLILLKRENPAILINEEIPQYIRGREEDLINSQYPECFHRIGALIRQNREQSVTQFSGRILDYINQNLYNPNLYSAMVQDHFNISQPTLQKLIKELTGNTFLSYVETHRLTRAKELLSEGTYTVREVSEKCGFSNTNSFYKAFRRFYGFPPSDIKSNPRKA